MSGGAAQVLEFSGPTTTIAEVIQNQSCNVERVTNTITDGNEFGTVTVVEITRDASGLPERILLRGRSGATQGQLTRE